MYGVCTAGRVLLTGSGEGVVAVSSVTSGLVVKVIQDHRGAPVTDITVAGRPVQVRGREGFENEKVQAAYKRSLLHSLKKLCGKPEYKKYMCEYVAYKNFETPKFLWYMRHFAIFF